MRLVTLALLSTVAFLRSCSGRDVVEPVTHSTGARFRDAIGVNVHLQYTGTRYHDADAVARALDYLGVTHVRDGGFRRGDEAFASYVQLARRGVRFDLFLNADLPSQLQRVDRFAHAVPGALDALEGPNEINNDPVSFAGRRGVAGAQAYQAALYDRAKADPALSGLPILNYTNWPPTGGRADAVNVHTYAKPGVATQTRIARDLALASAALPSGSPRYITETGAPTSPAHRSAPWLTPEDQANQMLISLLEAFRAGVRRTYVYELFDEGDAADMNAEAHYGLFDVSGSPRPAAVAIRSLIALLRRADQGDKAPIARINAKLIGSRGLLLQGRSGEAVLLIWGPLNSRSPVGVVLSAPRRVFATRLDGSRTTQAMPRRAWTTRLAGSPQVYTLSAEEDAEQ